MLASSATFFPTRRVMPNAHSFAFLRRSRFPRSKNSLSLGFEPGYPPSM